MGFELRTIGSRDNAANHYAIGHAQKTGLIVSPCLEDHYSVWLTASDLYGRSEFKSFYWTLLYFSNIFVLSLFAM